MMALASELLESRRERLSNLLSENKLDGAAFNPGPTLTYLTGLHFHLSERPVVLLATPGRTPALVLPQLETLKLENLGFELQAFPYGENPEDWNRAFTSAVQACGIGKSTVGVEAEQMRLLELNFLKAAAPEANFRPASEKLSGLRLYKDESETQAMRKAAEVAQNALQATLPLVRPGMTEKELAGELVVQLLRNGASPAMPFSPIVSAGPNSANPHASPTNRQLAEGDLLLFDWGAGVDDYVSDITRTFALGEVEPEYEQIATIVRDANQAAHAAAGPGVPMSHVDRAARDVIEKAGYGQFFTHRTGHGLGMQGHEEPYIRGDNDQLLEVGMVFTIEPGIYLGGRGGVRIEDDVLVTRDGIESFTSLSRELNRIM